MKFSTLLGLTCSSVFLIVACSSSPLKYEKTEELKKVKEFDESVKIETVTEPAATSEASKPLEKIETVAPSAEQAPAVEKGKAKKRKKSAAGTKAIQEKKQTDKVESSKTGAKKITPVQTTEKKSEQKSSAATAEKSEKKTEQTDKAVQSDAGIPTSETAVMETTRRQPEIEDDAGFDGRRPVKDPFRVGESVVHDVHYFKVSAAELRFKVEPFVMVNGRKSYTFAMEIKTYPLFSNFYSVEDRVETFVDYEDLVPRVFQLHVKETKQIREAKMLFDTEKNTATFWEKKVTKDAGEEEKKQHWEILPFSQNIYSVIFYMRNFKWETGKEYSFRIGNDNDNLVFSGKAIRREILDTKLGPMKAIVIQPNIHLKGKFQPIGDNFIWLSDDDRKYVLRIESKIKIGTLVSEVVSINPGK